MCQGCSNLVGRGSGIANGRQQGQNDVAGSGFANCVRRSLQRVAKLPSRGLRNPRLGSFQVLQAIDQRCAIFPCDNRRLFRSLAPPSYRASYRPFAHSPCRRVAIRVSRSNCSPFRLLWRLRCRQDYPQAPNIRSAAPPFFWPLPGTCPGKASPEILVQWSRPPGKNL